MDLNLTTTSSYPILTLPAEITAEIFSHYVGKRHNIRRRAAGPLLLASVCKSWWEICFSTCSIWASVVIALSEGERWDEDLQLLVQVWFARMCAGSLSGMLSFLSRYSSQWRNLGFTFHSSSSVLDYFIPGHIPSLTSLEISDTLGSSGCVVKRLCCGSVPPPAVALTRVTGVDPSAVDPANASQCEWISPRMFENLERDAKSRGSRHRHRILELQRELLSECDSAPSPHIRMQRRL
jgi:hypothetical protein